MQGPVVAVGTTVVFVDTNFKQWLSTVVIQHANMSIDLLTNIGGRTYYNVFYRKYSPVINGVPPYWALTTDEPSKREVI